MVIEIRRARSDRNAAEFYGYPYFTFYFEEIFCAHLSESAVALSICRDDSDGRVRRLSTTEILVPPLRPNKSYCE